MRPIWLGVLALGAACVEVEDPALPGPDACGAAGLADLVGEDESALAAVTFPVERVRVIRPGQAITMDYSPERLNIDLDAAGRITRVWCG